LYKETDAFVDSAAKTSSTRCGKGIKWTHYNTTMSSNAARVPLLASSGELSLIETLLRDLQHQGQIPANDMLALACKFGVEEEQLAKMIRAMVALGMVTETEMAGDAVRGDRPFQFFHGTQVALDPLNLSGSLKEASDEVEAAQARIERLRDELGVRPHRGQETGKPIPTKQPQLTKELLERIIGPGADDKGKLGISKQDYDTALGQIQ